ncbi:phage late control D family protein [Geodermatophilus sp. SYSU D01062]
MSTPTPSLYAAAPAVSLDGTPEPTLAAAVLSATVDDSVEGMRRCELVLGNWGATGQGLGFVLSDRRLLDFGRTVAITIGAGDRRGEVFSGAVTGLEEHYPDRRVPELVVLAEDRLQDLRMTRRTRTFEDVTDEDVVRRIAADHGLRAEVDVDPTRYRALAQLNESDLSFVRARARAVDAEVWLTAGTLHVQARARRDAGAVPLTYGADLRELTVLADLAHQRTGIGVCGWDVEAKEALEHEAAEYAVAGELDGGRGGASTLAGAFGSRPDRVVGLVPLSSDEARAVAEARFRQVSRRFVTGRGTAEGDARITVGGHVDLVRVSPAFAGRYFVTEVRHLYDGTSGFRTTFRIERPGLRGTS